MNIVVQNSTFYCFDNVSIVYSTNADVKDISVVVQGTNTSVGNISNSSLRVIDVSNLPGGDYTIKITVGGEEYADYTGTANFTVNKINTDL